MSTFDEIVDRRGSGSYKWDSTPDNNTTPMWVADMDFRTAPAIIEALRRRVDHGIFGYVKVPDEYYDALTRWFARRHNWHFTRNQVIYTSGVVPAISAIIKALAEPGSRVIAQTPAFNCFFSSIRNDKCILADNPLINTDGYYTIDFDALDRAADDAKLMILCNPHNPVGRIWTRDELLRIAHICKRHNVTVISDEIHCELTFQTPYVPFAPIAEEVGCRYVVCCSPSKAFNIAGLQIANIVTHDAEMLAKIDRAINDNEVCDVNPFGVVALIAAYNHGEEWLEALCNYLWDNYLTVKNYLADHLPGAIISPLEATYLMWIDVSPLGLTGDEAADLLQREAHIMVSPGSTFGPAGANFIRLNIACPRATLTAILPRLTATLAR